jgi:UDP-glucose 4-epimerase
MDMVMVEYLMKTKLPKPIDPYGVAKYACEMDIQIAGEQHGLDWCIITPS